MRGRQADLGCPLGRLQLLLALAAPLPTNSDMSLPWPGSTHGTAQLTPSAPEVHCGQHFKEDARRGDGVDGQPSPTLLFATDTSISKSSGLKVCEKEQHYTRRAPCALRGDAVLLLCIRYQVGNNMIDCF